MGTRWIVVAMATLLLAVAITGCDARGVVEFGQPAGTSGVRATADEVMRALAAKDGAALASLASSNGVRFSPSAYVDVEKDVVLSTAQLKKLWTSKKKRTWGYEDGTGAKIRCAGAKYCAKYVYDHEFAAADVVSVNCDKACGNTINNAAEVYPDCDRVEYYLPPKPGPGASGCDWAALRLVFAEENGEWRLVGVIHDQWTI